MADIETITTAGEFGALLLELHLIKKLLPIYNRRSRRVQKILVLKEVIVGRYKSVKLEYMNVLSPEDQKTFLGIFRSRKQALGVLDELAKTYQLCPKLLLLERGKGPCFSHQLGSCKGACAGAEKPAAYNARFDTAFAERRIRTWPFKAPIIYEERSMRGDTGHAFIIDRWCLLKSYAYDEAGHRELELGGDDFDYEAYKVMAGFILTSSNRRRIRVLKPGEIESLA